MPSDQNTAFDRPASSDLETPAPAGELVSCPECGKQLEGEPNFCPACGGDLRGLSSGSDTLDGQLKETLIDKRYRVLEKLGEGGMGAVYKVEHVRMGKLAALKLMRPDHAVDKALKARFLQEARVVARLSHPNTVQVFDSGELDDGGLFIAMEFVPGKDLAWHLKAHGAMGEPQALNIGVQLLASLQEAHEAGIIHRDLKPANVMLVRRRKSGDDQVKLLDFGIAKLQEAEGRKSTTGDFIGTPAYMSPEQIRGETVDARSDLYSVGCLLFELVSGRQPFEGPTPISILTQHYEAPIPRVAEVKRDASVSPAFQAVLDRALAKKAEDRFPDAESMRVALEQLQKTLGSKPAEYTPMPVELADKMLSREDFDSFERQLKRRRLVAPVIAALVLFVLLLAGVKGWRSLGSSTPSAKELEPNDQPQQATHIPLSTPVQGAIGSSVTEGDRDLYVASVQAGPHRLTLEGVPDLNLLVTVSQFDEQRLTQKLFLDDLGVSADERVDGLQLATGEVYLRIEERSYAGEPNRPSREKALVPYTLTLEPMSVEGTGEVEPNDAAHTAQPLPMTRAVTAWTGAQVPELERLTAERVDAPFSGADWFKVEGAADATVMVAVVPPERGAVEVIDGAALEAALKKGAKTLPVLVVKGAPQWLELKPMADGQRRVRVTAGDETLAGSEYAIAAGTGGDNGLAAVIDLGRLLEARSRLETRRALLEQTRQKFAGSGDLSRLGEN